MKTKRILLPVLVCVAAAGMFPIISLNPASPVELGLPFRLLILSTSFLICFEFGKEEPAVYAGWKTGLLALFNFGIACVSLVLRYLLEYGEVSNTYNFTVPNVVFHLLFVTLIATGTAAYQKKKQ